ncbi:MAG: IS3 family transposase [Lachnospiraceae bacterium]
MAMQHDKQFKLDAIQYYQDHKDLGVRGCAENLGIGYSTLTKWLKDFRESGDIPVRGSGNYSSDEQKEIARLRRELRDAQDALDVLKKSNQHSGKMTEAIYLEVSEKTEAAQKAGRRFSVSGMLKFLGVSRSGYRAWLHRVPSDTEKRRESVKAKIQDIYDDSKQNYGAPKITVELRKTGEVISERTVGTYMRQMGIRAQWSKPWTITTKDSDFSTELQNILDEQFNPDRPNAVWCSDITYIWTIDGFVYLTSIMDLFSRKIIAWTLSKTLEVSCVIDTINKAKARRNIDQPLIIHSDRGSQYVATEYKKVTENMQRSYSKKAFPWDNACIESFHSIIKREWLNRFKIHDYKQAYRLIFEYLEAFYNTKRIHSHCNYMSPNEFERVYERTHTEAELLAG